MLRVKGECKFCSSDRKRKLGYEENWDYCNLFYIDENYDMWAISDTPYHVTGPMKINFCPICGRKLHE